MNMSALANVMVGAHLRQNTSLLAGLLCLPAAAPGRQGLPGGQALKAMELVGMAPNP